MDALGAAMQLEEQASKQMSWQRRYWMQQNLVHKQSSVCLVCLVVCVTPVLHVVDCLWVVCARESSDLSFSSWPAMGLLGRVLETSSFCKAWRRGWESARCVLSLPGGQLLWWSLIELDSCVQFSSVHITFTDVLETLQNCCKSDF